MMEKIIEIIEKNFYKPIACVLGSILILAFFYTQEETTSKLFSTVYVRILIYCVFVILWILIWLFIVTWLPRNAKNKVGIVICVNTENEKQKIRLKKDFKNNLQKHLTKNNLDDVINVIILNEHQSKVAKKKIEIGITSTKTQKPSKSWNRFTRQLRSHFFIYGDLLEREDKYLITWDAIVLHSPIDMLVRNKLLQDFNLSWYRDIKFEEKFEILNFEFTADKVYVAISYIVGITALISGNVFLAREMHQRLYNDAYFINNIQSVPRINVIRQQLKGLIVEESNIISLLYYKKGEIDKSKESMNISLSYFKTYGALMQRAIYELLSNEPNLALNTIREAKSYAGPSFAWRYSEAFLLLHLKKYSDALKVLTRISKQSYLHENVTIEDVFVFNNKYLHDHPDELFILYLNAYLEFKKKHNYPVALKTFNNFLTKADKTKYELLLQKTKNYLVELESIVKNNR